MKRHQKTRKTKPKPTASKPLHEPLPDAAGIDLGATEIWVAVGPDRCQMPVRRFGTFTQDLLTIVEWLLECGIRTVAMEATGIYWVPLHQHLSEAGIEVCLVNARHVKMSPAAKAMSEIVSGCSISTASGSCGPPFGRPKPSVMRGPFTAFDKICSARVPSISNTCRRPWTR